MSDDPDEGDGGEAGDAGEAAGEDARRGEPFESLADDVRDREGDPFETLAGGEGDEPTGEPATGPGGSEPDEPAGAEAPSTAADTDEWTMADRASEQGPAGPTDPFSEFEDVAGDGEPDVGTPGGAPGPEEPGHRTEPAAGDAGERPGDPFEAAESAFEEMEVGDLDPDQVWEELDDARGRGSVAESRERTYAEVSKHTYCEGCQWFSGPPQVACSHEGTDIIEFVDIDTVRVVDCPVVAERRELQQEE